MARGHRARRRRRYFIGPHTWSRVAGVLADPKAAMGLVYSTVATLWAEAMAMYTVWFILGVVYQSGVVMGGS